jgi:hypothetical protein
MNTADTDREIDFGNYAERTVGFRLATDILSGDSHALNEKIKIPPVQLWILELKK